MGFEGPLYPVNPDAKHVGGVRAYPSVRDIPDDVDLAVVSVPAAAVPAVIDDCGAKGVRGVIVISGGFGERGGPDEREAGQQAQRQLVLAARTHGMRVVGPNCLGIVNTDPAIRLNASLAPLPPLAGRAGFFSQSGALGVAVLGEASRRGLGVSTFVSAGNRADVSGNDLLQFWATDPATDLVLMYLESFGNPRKFARLARRLGRSKPIVAVKGGAGMVVPGLRQTSVEVPERSVRALFEASGVIRVGTLGELFDVALLLSSQPLPAGPRVAVVGNSTAIGVLATNALEEEGLRLARLDDIGVDAASEAFESALRTALDDAGVDIVVVVFVPPLQRGSSEAVAAALRRVADTSEKPVLSTFLGFEGVPGGLAAAGDTSPAPGSVPSYPSPERAVRALGRVVRYAAWRRRAPGVVPQLDGLDIDGARELVRELLATTPAGRELTWEESRVLLGCAGITPALEAEPGIDAVLTVHDDKSFGALVSFGLGGVATELLGDRAYAAVPLTTADATELIGAPRAAPLLAGYGGAAPADREALAGLALRLSVLADALPEISECALAVSAGTDRATVTAAEIWVAPASARPDTGPRRLRGL
jgi:acyl-CoA synthetase (NDP forming)